jgi:hypothetical protein
MRLDDELDDKVRRAADALGMSVSAFIRLAAEERADQTLADTGGNAARFADVIGVISGGGGRARRTGDAFAESLAERRAVRKRS